MKKLYLAGGIHEVEDPRSWRLEVTARLPYGWEAHDPTLFEPQRGEPRNTVMLDLRMILNSDVLLLRALTPSWGTAMETFFAHNHRVPVIAWVEDPRALQSLWLCAHVDHLVGGIQDAVKLLSLY